MSDKGWTPISEADFEKLLQNSLPELPPEDIVADITPWKKAMKRLLAGMAMTAVTFNFAYLNYILPAVGMLLMLLGFRTLRCENRWFNRCFVITVIRSACFFPLLILNTTIYQSRFYTADFIHLFNGANLALQFALFFCLWQALRTVQQKVDLQAGAGSAVTLIVWYGLVCLLGLIRYSGVIISLAMIVGYFFIIRSLWKLSKELDNAGYAVSTSSVKLTDRMLTVLIAVLLLIGCVCGYLLGNSYKMDWEPVDPAHHDGVEDIKNRLLELGFPEYVLCDLQASDIAACDGAVQVIVDVYDHAVNDGRKIVNKEPGKAGSGADWRYEITTVYDLKELRITGVGVQLADERETWIIIHHFLWTHDPGFYGTECIQLWPVYRLNKGWAGAGDVTGRVLFDRGDTTFVSPYHWLGSKTYTSDSIFFGQQTATDIFATFSMPNKGENHRGYIAYPIAETQDGYIIDCWINYLHRRKLFQYPAMTAIESRITNSWSESGVFKSVQDALQFYSTEDGAKLVN